MLATTAVLIAVFLPVGFLQGNTGRLFRELSVALAALTLTPMMASKLLRPHTGPHAVHGNRLSEWLNARFTRMAGGYRRVLDRHVHRIWLFAGVMVATLVAMVVLLVTVALLGFLLSGAWPQAEAAGDRARREASSLVAAYLQWHLERGLRSLDYVDR